MKHLFKTLFILTFCYANLLAQSPVIISRSGGGTNDTTGTFSIPANSQALIEVWGGGGGGGAGIDNACNPSGTTPAINTNKSAGGGGGGGGYSKLVIPNTTGSPLTISFIVGFTAGGAGGTATSPDGATGRTYNFSANTGTYMVSANGGAGGTAGVIAVTDDLCNGTCLGSGGAGGVGNTGTGTAGGNANGTTTSATNVSSTIGASGAGGNATNGGTGAPAANIGFPGTTGVIPGGGGSGGASSQNCGTGTNTTNSNRNGGTGGAGRVQYTISAIMPITLKTFTATQKGTSSLITWTTDSETNNDRFIIERSADGHDFSPINEQKGAGDSRVVLNYSFTDDSPLSGMNYYRLKQVDYDGKYSHSNVAYVMHENKNLSLKYNSAHGNINIGSDLLNYNLSIVNSIGQEVKIISGLKYSSDVSIQELNAGVYFVFIKDKSNTILTKTKILK